MPFAESLIWGKAFGFKNQRAPFLISATLLNRETGLARAEAFDTQLVFPEHFSIGIQGLRKLQEDASK